MDAKNKLSIQNMNTFETFLQLHKASTPLMLGNVWDVTSAQTFEAMGFSAIATSSAALAKAYGYDDGEKMPFSDLLRMAERIAKNVSIPFSVDMEGGYSRTAAGIVENIERLYHYGIAGINLEDSTVAAQRTLGSIDVFQKKLDAVTNALQQKNIRLFINVRTDTYLLGVNEALAETQRRAKAYQQAGASGLFVPCITNAHDIREVVNSTPLPLNVLSVPGLPAVTELTKLGVKRISLGNAVYDWLHSTLKNKLKNASPEAWLTN
jgi:2-methylisocitrate lyase-like PEP mutase family enzyme